MTRYIPAFPKPIRAVPIENAEKYRTAFEARTKRTDSCWLWRGFISNQGYGEFCITRNGRPFALRAHRLAWELFRGPLPLDRVIDHLCRVRHCVNPDHLELVTVRENLLRGESPFVQNARKTHCKRGHEFTEPNLYIRPHDGARICRACERARRGAVEGRKRGKTKPANLITHCPRGHAYTPENTVITHSGRNGGPGRRCKICIRAMQPIYQRRYKEKKRKRVTD